ncbi:hypothetical protein P154DRAFT_449531, partial [Amniculicola lignicola CBS 123094]
VIVGAAGHLVFLPLSINASISTIVAFDFLSLNYSLTQSSLWDPCNSYSQFNTRFQ